MNILFNIRVAYRLILSVLVVGLLISCSVTRKYQKESTAKWGNDISQFEQQDICAKAAQEFKAQNIKAACVQAKAAEVPSAPAKK